MREMGYDAYIHTISYASEYMHLFFFLIPVIDDLMLNHAGFS